MIYAEKYDEVEKEFRRIVDDVIRQELELLQVRKFNKKKLYKYICAYMHFNMSTNIFFHFRPQLAKKPRKIIKKLADPARKVKRKKRRI